MESNLTPFWSTAAQWELLLPLLAALVFSALIGIEREMRAKSAGLRTHTLVGVGAAIFMLVSKYGFGDWIGVANVTVDPSRVAAQVASGIGFIGAGLIFVKRDVVRGLTTAATIWVAAAVGMAAGAGLPLLAAGAVAGHYTVTLMFPPLVKAANRLRKSAPVIQIEYLDGRGVLRAALRACTRAAWAVQKVEVEKEEKERDSESVTVTLHLEGRRDPAKLADLAERISGIKGVLTVRSGDDLEADET